MWIVCLFMYLVRTRDWDVRQNSCSCMHSTCLNTIDFQVITDDAMQKIIEIIGCTAFQRITAMIRWVDHIGIMWRRCCGWQWWQRWWWHLMGRIDFFVGMWWRITQWRWGQITKIWWWRIRRWLLLIHNDIFDVEIDFRLVLWWLKVPIESFEWLDITFLRLQFAEIYRLIGNEYAVCGGGVGTREEKPWKRFDFDVNRQWTLDYDLPPNSVVFVGFESCFASGYEWRWLPTARP